MSLRPVTDSGEVKDSFDLLFQNLSRNCEPAQRFVGWQGGREMCTLYWNALLRFWSVLRLKQTEPRYWCFFGTDDPSQRKGLNIICEANPPKESFDRRVAGVFLRDESGRTFLAHSGKVGGGRKGVGKSNFLEFYRGTLETVKWPDGKESELIVIGQVDGQHLPSQVAHFVKEVAQFKQSTARQKGRLQASFLPASFTPEFSGNRKSYETKRTVVSECDHGLLISALADELEKRHLKYGNDKYRDLFVVSSRGKMQTLFEGKTDLGTSSIYGGVGQLMLHGAAESTAPNRVLVVPGTPKPRTRAALKKLGVMVLSYTRNRDGFRFASLETVLH